MKDFASDLLVLRLALSQTVKAVMGLPEVREIINKTNKNMREFLTSNFEVKDFHPMTKDFSASKMPSELLGRVED